MSSNSDENVSVTGHSITYETIAGGKIRPKIKIWFDHLDTEFGAERGAKFYKNVLEKLRAEGFVVDGDQK